jgi:hypothetical protein
MDFIQKIKIKIGIFIKNQCVLVVMQKIGFGLKVDVIFFGII